VQCQPGEHLWRERGQAHHGEVNYTVSAVICEECSGLLLQVAALSSGMIVAVKSGGATFRTR